MEIEELRDLVAEGRERGYLTFEEIAALPRGGRGHEGADRRAPRAPVERGVDIVSRGRPRRGRAGRRAPAPTASRRRRSPRSI